SSCGTARPARSTSSPACRTPPGSCHVFPGCLVTVVSPREARAVSKGRTMPRIPEVPADKAGWRTKLVYRWAKREYGAVPQPGAVAAQHPGLLLGMGLGEFAVQKAATALPARVRDLERSRVATQIGC